MELCVVDASKTGCCRATSQAVAAVNAAHVRTFRMTSTCTLCNIVNYTVCKACNSLSWLARYVAAR